MGVTCKQAQAVLDLAKQQVKIADGDGQKPHAFLSVATAARYLRAHHTEAKAAKALAASFEYRTTVRTEGLGVDPAGSAIVWSEMEKRGLYIAALSDGNAPPSPVLMLRKRDEPFDIADFEDYRRAFFYVLDCTQLLADRGHAAATAAAAGDMVGESGEDDVDSQRGQWTVIMDMTSYKSGNSPPMSVTLETVRIVQRHFPERAKKIIVLDAPRIFSMFWTMVRPFIDAVTREKIEFMTRKDPQFSELSTSMRECAGLDMVEGKRRHAELLVREGFLVRLDSGQGSHD